MDSGYIRDLLKRDQTLGIAKFYCGKIDNKYEKAICVYNLQNEPKREVTIGQVENSTRSKKYSILIRWNKNYIETERHAQMIYDYLTSLNHSSYNNIEINYIELLNDVPVDLHCEEDGIYERLIDLKIYYKEI